MASEGVLHITKDQEIKEEPVDGIHELLVVVVLISALQKYEWKFGVSFGDADRNHSYLVGQDGEIKKDGTVLDKWKVLEFFDG